MTTGKDPQDGWTVTETDENTRARETHQGKKKDTGIDQFTMAMARMAEAQLQFQHLHQQSMLQQQQQQQLQQHQQQQFQQQLQCQQLEMMERVMNTPRPEVRPQLLITPYKDGEDVEGSLETFESMMWVQNIDEEQWVLAADTSP